MSAQKSLKGRPTAAQQTEQISRRKSGPKSEYRGSQQFGGVGPQRDKDSVQLSSRARKALEAQGARKKKAA
ncbi:MAG TPA: hypothetical protein DCS07_11895 [Bdellovibrionales bacterium]|nr:MAG: hypothetical protein A2Z97_08100 [Bdellovibrionales bacterium GWB1_52_6]OFZ03810.1 MAG: hypothetical protein A2X97_15540 [Bdellovibrionales bacterium GWA1_52_35]OFZ36865.1 MAG: hypothetical protein A2070_00270 [Bdellovibrionales bacterium GWC1_52_8]HAR43311.1 hypothetical protein [Bdellovibrionales bacterium]HCM40909.1 hypothetical protein [Bdellovibrionales bacterium]